MTKYWSWIEGIIQKNGGNLVTGPSCTYADLLIAGAVSSIQSGDWTAIDTNFFDQFPGVMATSKSVQENDQIKAYKAAKNK